MKEKQRLEDTKELTLKFEFNPKDGIDNPALSLAEDSDTEDAGKPRFYLLTKGDGESFGFCLREEVGYKGHIIRQVACGGMAQRRGLQDGDRILEVNGEYVDNMEHFRVAQKIKASGNQVAVTVLDGNAYEVAKALDKNLAELLPGHTRPRLCHVVKDKSGFGFRVSAPEGVKGTFRLSVTSNGPADKAGVPSDSWLLELNGASVRNYTYALLTRKLKQSGSKVTLLVIDAKSEEFYRLQGVRVIAAMADAATLPFKARKLHMVKGPDGYGFLLKEERGSSGRMGQFLCEMDTGLPADRAGMRDGDRLLAVNGEGVEGLCHQEVVDMIRASGNQVTLLVIDPDGDKFYSSGPRSCEPQAAWFSRWGCPRYCSVKMGTLHRALTRPQDLIPACLSEMARPLARPASATWTWGWKGTDSSCRPSPTSRGSLSHRSHGVRTGRDGASHSSHSVLDLWAQRNPSSGAATNHGLDQPWTCDFARTITCTLILPLILFSGELLHQSADLGTLKLPLLL
ncbi:Na(+)/H(+) exchange regulatory cofactor NHE-RF4 isoform X2 [Caretta caretta]|uniref:Na(+)/H(+) exchange regulatory cofactor NHE-RF4 isoform X2 n=1 Tax=Caretta caretta TaxID=8467 RepID=UPI003F4BCA58